ncbi:MAG: dockerin type I domain-containing protein [Candidatus Poribacteria bacterium]|nr:dockerin type I domain-containing protein [Candidatus Poribacteria bacterium]
MKKLICLLVSLSLFTIGYAQETGLDGLLASDTNADGIVNILDLTFVASHFGEALSEDQHPNPDVNGDGTVNILDLTLVASYFGKYSGIPLKLTDKTFDNVVRNTKLPILVEFKSDS